MTRKRVLIVDDSALMRELLGEVFKGTSDLEVVGAARDADKAWQMIGQLKPDVLTLDIEMPGMDGLTFLRRLMREHPLPVVMVSTLTERGSEMAVRALSYGAVDVVEKPRLDLRSGTMSLAQELIHKVRGAALARVARRALPDEHGSHPSLRTPQSAPNLSQPLVSLLPPAPIRAPAPALSIRPRTPVVRSVGSTPSAASHASVPTRTTGKIVAIGASTGGTEALAAVLTKLPADAPPVLVVQHMPPAFTTAFAARLDRLCRVRVKEAADGDLVRVGQVLIAPGGRHMRLLRGHGDFAVRITDDPPVGLHRPSVDVLFESCARAAGGFAVGVILTGMGADGAYGLTEMKKAGANTIAQDEASCVVFGMPKEAIARGGAGQVLALDKIAQAILRASA
jgi:two-component system, chemotaxis family, protein-glutamate methylesterase/glutaminase